MVELVMHWKELRMMKKKRSQKRELVYWNPSVNNHFVSFPPPQLHPPHPLPPFSSSPSLLPPTLFSQYAGSVGWTIWMHLWLTPTCSMLISLFPQWTLSELPSSLSCSSLTTNRLVEWWWYWVMCKHFWYHPVIVISTTYMCCSQLLCVGPTGTGKSLTVTDKLLKGMPAKYLSNIISFSARTSANQTQVNDTSTHTCVALVYA